MILFSTRPPSRDEEHIPPYLGLCRRLQRSVLVHTRVCRPVRVHTRTPGEMYARVCRFVVAVAGGVKAWPPSSRHTVTEASEQDVEAAEGTGVNRGQEGGRGSFSLGDR